MGDFGDNPQKLTHFFPTFYGPENLFLVFNDVVLVVSNFSLLLISSFLMEFFYSKLFFVLYTSFSARAAVLARPSFSSLLLLEICSALNGLLIPF